MLTVFNVNKLGNSYKCIHHLKINQYSDQSNDKDELLVEGRDP